MKVFINNFDSNKPSKLHPIELELNIWTFKDCKEEDDMINNTKKKGIDYAINQFSSIDEWISKEKNQRHTKDDS